MYFGSDREFGCAIAIILGLAAIAGYLVISLFIWVVKHLSIAWV
jgi:hypothetical protein